MFPTVPLFIIRSFSLYTQQYIQVCWHLASKVRTFRQQTCMYCCVYSEKLLMTDRGTVRNMLEFYSKNKFEKLVHLVGFIIRIVKLLKNPPSSLLIRYCVVKYLQAMWSYIFKVTDWSAASDTIWESPVHSVCRMDTSYSVVRSGFI